MEENLNNKSWVEALGAIKKVPTQELIDTRKICVYDMLSKVLDLDNISFTEDVYKNPGVEVVVQMHEGYKLNQMYESNIAGDKLRHFKHREIELPLRVKFEKFTNRLTFSTFGGSQIVPPKTPDEDTRYCRECGEVEQIAYVRTNASCDEYKCKVCGHEFQWTTREKL